MPEMNVEVSAFGFVIPDMPMNFRTGTFKQFVKALNELIARRSNREDGCKGKFWESRFKCQALLEEHAVLSCMAYVDLNPARAAMCDTLAESDHTAIQRRLREREGEINKIKSAKSIVDRPLKPVAGLDTDALMAMSETSYVQLVQCTGEQARSDKSGKFKPLTENKREAAVECRSTWVRQVQGTESIYYRAIGSAGALMAKAEEFGQVWMKGVATEVAGEILRERPT